MDRTERFHRIRTLLAARRGMTARDIQTALEISPATFKRDLAYLRDRMHLPIEWSAERGYYLAPTGNDVELPGLWFSPQEIHALLTMQHLLVQLDSGGLLAPHISPLQQRLDTLLGAADNTIDEIRRRVLLVGIGRRHNTLAFFETVGSALLRRQRLAIRYFARGRGEEGEREVSPQRLVHYRDNWYLDAWCHLRGGLRSFAIDSIREARALEQPALDVPQADIDTALGAGYGIFGGQDIHWATLRFSPERARWVAAEHWHPEQRGHTGADGYYILEIPYADHRELLMDILKHGVHCEVLGPPELRQILHRTLAQMQKKYTDVP